MNFRIFIYRLLSWLFAPLLVLVVLLCQLVKKRPYQHLFELTTQPKGDYYWIQAPSVGEVILAKTLINQLKPELTDPNWLIITSTYSGYCTAKQLLGDEAVILYFHFPLDYTFAIKRLLRCYPPLALIMVESDIRPNLVYQVSRKHGKIMLVNGRIGPSFMKRYRWQAFFLEDSWKRIDFYSVKSMQDREAFMAIGAPSDRVIVNGNFKFDQNFPIIGVQQRRRLLRDLGLNDDCRLIVAGSTHPGEEEIILDAFRMVWEQYPEVFLLIAPRHLRRVPEVETLLNSRKLGYWLRSKPRPMPGARVIVLDTYGELATIYGLAEVAIIGYSFMYGDGHNILEPIGYGSPVFFGPHIKHFQEIADRAITVGVGFQVTDSNSLAKGCLRFLSNEQLRRETAMKAQALIQENRGAAKRNVDLILATLGKQYEKKEEPVN